MSSRQGRNSQSLWKGWYLGTAILQGLSALEGWLQPWFVVSLRGRSLPQDLLVSVNPQLSAGIYYQPVTIQSSSHFYHRPVRFSSSCEQDPKVRLLSGTAAIYSLRVVAIADASFLGLT